MITMTKLLNDILQARKCFVPARGLIFDRNGEPLAVNELFFSVYLEPALNAADLNNAISKIVNTPPKSQNFDDLMQIHTKQDSSYNDYLSRLSIMFKITKAHATLIQDDSIQVRPTFRYT